MSDILERAKEAANIDYAPIIAYDDWQALIRELVVEVKRLRSEREVWIKHYNDVQEKDAEIEGLASQLREHDDAPLYNQIRGLEFAIEQKDAQIKELEVQIDHDREVLDSWKADRDNWIVRCERLEAAFLEAKIGDVLGEQAVEGKPLDYDDADRKARAALEEIRAGGKDESH